MPFDGSGNFSRLFSFTQDRNNGIKILASRVDGEFDNVASALNQGFFRTGIVGMTGDLNMGLNRLVGLSDGAAGNPATKFSADTTTGLYLAGYGKLGVAAGGAQRAVFDSNGLAVTGAVTVNGNQVWHAGNLNPAGYAALSGATFSGGVAASSLVAQGTGIGGLAIQPGNSTTTGYIEYRDKFGSQLGYIGAQLFGNAITYYCVGGHYFGNRVNIESTLNANGAITQGGNQVWHAGNLNPSNYAPLSGAVFTGSVGIGTPPSTPLDVKASNGTRLHVASGVSFTAPRLFAGNAADTAYTPLEIQSDQLYFFNQNAALIATLSNGGGLSLLSGLAAGGAITQGGNQVWHAGNLNPSSYVPLTGATMSGPLTVQTPNAGTTGGLIIRQNPATALAYLQFVNTDSTGQLGALSVNSTGLASYTGEFRAASISTDGAHFLSSSFDKAFHTFDVNDYLVFDRLNNKLLMYIGGRAVWSVDANGTMRARGDVFGNMGDSL